MSTGGGQSNPRGNPTRSEQIGTTLGKGMAAVSRGVNTVASGAKRLAGKAVNAADKVVSFTEKLQELCKATGADSDVQAAMMQVFTEMIGQSAMAAIEGAIPGWSLLRGGADFAKECDHLISIVRERARLERRIERDYFRARDATKAVEGLLKLMARDVASSSARTATSAARFASAVAGAAATVPGALDAIVSAVTAVVDLMRKCAEVALEVRDMVEGNRLIQEHFHNGTALQKVFENAFIGTFIVAKAPEAYLMNVSLALYADPGTTTCLKKMRAVIAEAKERASGYLEESGLTVDPALDDDEEYGAFMQVGQLVTQAALMEQLRAGVALKPTVANPRPVTLMEQIRAGVALKPTVINPRPVFPPEPSPPIPVQIMVGEIVAPSPPDVRPALDHLEATLRRVAEDYQKTLSRYVFSSLRNTSPESMATYAYLTNRVAADIGRSKLNGDIVSVPSIVRALLGGPPLLDAARQEAARRDILSVELDKLRVLNPSAYRSMPGRVYFRAPVEASRIFGFEPLVSTRISFVSGLYAGPPCRGRAFSGLLARRVKAPVLRSTRNKPPK